MYKMTILGSQEILYAAFVGHLLDFNSFQLSACLKILYACVCLLFMSVKSPCGLFIAFSVLVGRHVLLNVAPEDIPVEI